MSRNSPWPFTVFDMKPGTLHEVRASCTFAKRSSKKDLDIEFVQVEEGVILMSLGYERVPHVLSANDWARYDFKFLYGEQIIFLPIRAETDEQKSEEEIIESIQISLFSFVKPTLTSEGYAQKSSGRVRESFLIGDSSRGNDDDGYDEFH